MVEISVSLSKDEISSASYNSNRSFNIFYKPAAIPKAGLRIQKYHVPNDIKEINIFDADFL